MRLILSRKGFDSQYGKVPSPILPDGRLISLPIPSPEDPQRLGDLRIDGVDIGALVADLTRGRMGAKTRVHVDPDLDPKTLQRSPRWRPALGQIAAAQSHLNRQGVDEGDLFLFFGWFRHVHQVDSHWCYLPKSPDMHALFGWLQVGEIIPVSGRVREVERSHPWLRSHPHVASSARYRSTNNTIYVAARSLCLGGVDCGLSGGGVFRRFRSALQLSATGASRSVWRLPAWFAPVGGRPPLSYHGKPTRWQPDSATVLLQAVAKGQEFVLDCAHYPEAVDWLKGLFADSVASSPAWLQ